MCRRDTFFSIVGFALSAIAGCESPQPAKPIQKSVLPEVKLKKQAPVSRIAAYAPLFFDTYDDTLQTTACLSWNGGARVDASPIRQTR